MPGLACELRGNRGLVGADAARHKAHPHLLVLPQPAIRVHSGGQHSQPGTMQVQQAWHGCGGLHCTAEQIGSGSAGASILSAHCLPVPHFGWHGTAISYSTGAPRSWGYPPMSLQACPG